MTPKTGMYIGIGASVGLLLLIGAVVLYVKHHKETIGDPTDATLAPGVLDKMDLNLDLTKLISPPPSAGSGAEDLYQSVVRQAFSMGDGFKDKLDSTTDPEKDATLKGMLDKLEEAADKGLGGDLDFDAIVAMSPGTEWQIDDMLRGIGTVAFKSGMSMRSDKNKQGSEKALRAGLIWGDRLFHNGIYVSYKSAGLGCISEGLAQYERQYAKDNYDEPAKAGAAKQLYETYLPISKKWYDKEKIIRHINPTAAPGDLWNLAENDKDRAWQAEGLMWLGVAKWNTVPEGPQRTAIVKYLDQKSSSADAVLAKRAMAAAAFTRENARAVANP